MLISQRDTPLPAATAFPPIRPYFKVSVYVTDPGTALQTVAESPILLLAGEATIVASRRRCTRKQVLVKLAHAWAAIVARRFVIAVVLCCT